MKRREPRAAETDDAKEPVPGAHNLARLHAAVLEHTLAGRLLDAQNLCRQAFAMDPENADTMHLMGIVCSEAKQFDHAVGWTSRAIRKDAKPAYLTTLGIALLRLGRHDEAIKVFDKAIQLEPNNAKLWWHLGNALMEAELSSEALLCFQHTIKLDPRHADAAYNAGYVLHASGRFEEALASFCHSAELRPDHAPTLYMRALVLKSLNKLEEAMADNLRAIELDPVNADACNNMGVIVGDMGRIEEALSWYDRSLEIKPDFAGAAVNRARSLADLHRFDEAMAAYRQVIVIASSDLKTVFNMALLQLLMGNFEAGLSGREMRWRIPEITPTYPKLSGPMWLGSEPVAGKTIVVCSDEGLGDSIRFARYVPMLAARGARVILVVEETLRPILSGIGGVWQCLPKLAETMLPPFDFHCPITSLPLAFETRLDTIPAAEAYLPPPESERVQAWEKRLGPREKLRVGLVWSGNPKHVNDRNRSMPLRVLSRIQDVDATFVSLQKNPRPQDVEVLREMPDIVDLSAELTDFAETAALVSCLDLVISVDTSVAHLAAALGRPTWILLPYRLDWRWLLDRDDSPWYPTVRLFRQTETREYGSVIERVRTELAAAAADKRFGATEKQLEDSGGERKQVALLPVSESPTRGAGNHFDMRR
jgi:tetratricopeptide (TPR) repeat protein